MQNKNLLVLGLLVVVVMAAAIFVQAGGGPRSAAQCRDGLDNDGDTYIDYPADPGCASKNDNNELGTVQCDNGVSDDFDGLIDYPDDPGCASVTDNNEKSSIKCDNGLDDDSDTYTDYPADTLCSSATDNDEADASCSDTDGGFVTGTQGTASGSFNGNPFSNTDACESSTLLREYYCSSNQRANQQYNCAGNVTAQCVNGACV
ncbi:MAG TPA: hypothetical protein HA282_04530 [Nanoarchaeota archaeon]|nr:hypothetical protein [Candidatus Pacearchaeota archaeon]HIH17762.1 hypothetical protein [Nanoarchaeota archaeon]HIH33787.1 hypothetical protein [Nanoarchaeota archaeon]HIH50801.1 hypothetical protein [Nanoarchaeota archaeon]HIH66451.1 hypothetical protein [Nanoarchaeota archaeon]